MSDKRSAGQPTKYKPEYCEMLIEHMSKGKPFQTFAAKIKVKRSTLYNWASEIPEFAEAKAMGLDACLDNWIEFILAARVTRPGDKAACVPIVQMFMRNVFGWDRVVEVKGLTKELSEMTTDELKDFALRLAKDEDSAERKLDA